MTDNDTTTPAREDRSVTIKTDMEEKSTFERVTTITARHYEPEAEWHPKDWLNKLERDSEKKWEELDDEQRQAMIVIVKDCLRRMAEDPHVWLPSSIKPVTGHRLDLWICINFDDVDDEVIRRRTEAERALIATRTDLIDIERDLRPEAHEPAPPGVYKDEKGFEVKAEEVARAKDGRFYHGTLTGPEVFRQDD